MAMPKKQAIKTNDIVLVAFFAALTIIGTMIRIPLPSALGTPFIHLGNSVLLLAVLLLGYKKGALAGGMGFAIFDFLNGFPLEAPYFFVESFIVGGVAAFTFQSLRKTVVNDWIVIPTAIMAGIAKLVMTFLKNTVMAWFMTGNLNVSLVSASSTLPATIINVLSTVVIVSLLYPSLKKLTLRFYKKTRI